MTPNLQGAFRALADPTRRQILVHLSAGEMTIGDVVDKFSVTRGAIRKHLNVLEEGQLISIHPRGRERINRLEPDALKTVSEWLNFFDQFWDQKLDGLQRAISKEQGKK
jgi:DNA-binding transcriptional ArsR family regulator